MKKILIVLSIVLGLSSSCTKDFLEEDTKAVANPEALYATPNGLEKLVTSCYVSNKVWYAKEEGYDFSEVGTDTYTWGQQNANKPLAFLDNTFNSYNGRNTVLWVEFYKGVNACNLALAYLNDAKHPMIAGTKAIRKAEVLFLRAHYYWLLTESWGSVPMPLTPTEAGLKSTATRTSIKDIYNQIKNDLTTANDLLKTTDNVGSTEYGRVTKDAVLGFRARIYLTMASYIKNAGNPNSIEGTASEYYTLAKTDADAVINSGKYSFYPVYSDLWNLTNSTSSQNKESIWAINYSRGTNALMGGPELTTEYSGYNNVGGKAFDQREGGHHGFMMFNTHYDGIPGLARDIPYGRPFIRYAPNKYLIDAYNTTLDARFQGQFRTHWMSNNKANIPKWSDFNLGTNPIPGGKLATDPVFKVGDTALVISNRDYPDSRVVAKKTGGLFLYLDGPYILFDANILFLPDGKINPKTNNDFFISLKKMEDAGRTAVATQNGGRDAFVLRLAEMYLIAAEAAMETGLGGYSYLKTLADSRALNKDGAALLNAYGIAGDGDITKDKLLDERAREFPGEQLRWFDLKRSHSPLAFADRLKKYNFDSKAQSFHYYRPIPQIQLDAIENAGEFGQNTGY